MLPLGMHSPFCVGSLSRFLVYQAFVRRFAFRRGPAAPFFLCLSPIGSGCGAFRITRVSCFARVAIWRRFVAGLWKFLLLRLQLYFAIIVSLSVSGLRDNGFLHCSRRISFLHGFVCAVLEIAVRSPRLLLHLVLW